MRFDRANKTDNYRKKITFKHNGEIYTFITEPNPYNDCQMWYFRPQRRMYAGTLQEAKKMEWNIRQKTEIIEEE